MDDASALARLQAMCAATEEPVLSSADLEQLVALARRADADGVAPSADGWVPTYDLRAAAAEGWRIKAARVAHRFNFSKDGQQFDVGELRKSFLDMAAQYGGKGLYTLSTSGISDSTALGLCYDAPVEEYDPYSEGWPA